MAGAAVGFEPVCGMDSLLSGNFTGKFAISYPKMQIYEQETATPQRLLRQFPKQKNRDNLSVMRELGIENREVKLLRVLSDFLQVPNLVFGTHNRILRFKSKL